MIESDCHPFRNLLCLTVGAIAMIAFAVSARAADGTPPNILIILLDDSGYSDFGCYGSEIPTPNVDRLAAEGIRFTQFTNASRCMPTRTALLAGNYNHLVGNPGMEGPGARYDEETGERIGRTSNGAILRETPTLGEVFRYNGYETFLTGKWHAGQKFFPQWPLQRGFDRFFGTIAGATGNKFDGTNVYEGNEPIEKPVPEDWYIGNAITDKAIQYLRERDRSKPFLLYHAPLEPHWPWTAPEEDVKPFRGRYDEGYVVWRQRRFENAVAKGVIPEGVDIKPLDPYLPPWEELKERPEFFKLVDKMEHHAGMIKNIDDNVGRLVAELERQGELDNTIILFLSDNGGEFIGGQRGRFTWVWPTVLNSPFRLFKGWQHQGGVATPLIVRWPEGGVPAGAINKGQVGHVKDIMATLLEATGAEFPEKNLRLDTWPIDNSDSLLPAMRDPDYAEPRTVFYEHNGNRAVRQGKWKAVMLYNEADRVPGAINKDKGPPPIQENLPPDVELEYNERPPSHDWELYDMEKDPTEMHNLADQYPERVAEMKALFYEFWESTNWRLREDFAAEAIEAAAESE